MNENATVFSAAGVRMPRILYGTAWKKERTAALVERAATLGFRGVDTACQPKHYHEPGVGEGLAACFKAGLSRAEVYIQTKFTPVDGQDPERMPYDPAADLSDQVAQSAAASLKNLGTDYLDGLILHSPLATEEETLTVWCAMEALVDAHKVRQLGMSNCYEPRRLERLYAAARIKPALLQNRFYAATGYDRGIRAFCRKAGILYQSFWTLTANPHVLEDSTVQRLAVRYGRTPAQILFRYLTQNGIIPLTGTASEIHMREDLAIFEFELTAEECRDMDRLF